MLYTLRRYWITLQFLKSSQIGWRIFYYLKPRKVNTKIPNIVVRKNFVAWKAFTYYQQSPFQGQYIHLLNQQRICQWPITWNDPEAEKLWLYHLHYFDYGSLLSSSELQALIHQWIVDNPPCVGIGWDPYPVSIRCVQWILSFLSEKIVDPSILQSLYVQLRYLYRRLEWHLLGNHLVVNAKALIFGGLFFEGKEATTWLKKGLTILEKQLAEQILSDGGHFELSPLYHARFLEDLLDIIQLFKNYQQTPPHFITHYIPRLLTWLSWMTAPNGEMVLLNDAVLNAALSYEALSAYAKFLGFSYESGIPRGSHFLQASGYARLSNVAAMVWVDVAALGPDYLPGHGHADTLNFCIFLKNNWLVVDSGVSCYGESLERLRQRGTAAHNTICIDHKNSSDVWAGFRVAERATVFDIEYRDNYIAATQDGYRSLGVFHRRSWELLEDKLVIRDHLTGEGVHHVLWSLHFHPCVKLERENSHSWCVKMNRTKARLLLDKKLSFQMEQTSYHPEFGIAQDTVKLVGRADISIPITLHCEWRWR